MCACVHKAKNSRSGVQKLEYPGLTIHDLCTCALFRVGPARSVVRIAVAASYPGGRWWGLWLPGRRSCG